LLRATVRCGAALEQSGAADCGEQGTCPGIPDTIQFIFSTRFPSEHTVEAMDDKQLEDILDSM